MFAWDPCDKNVREKARVPVSIGVGTMIEIRFHGRGGQGVVVASEILAVAFFKENKSVQAFPTFGVERRGAPVAAFLRVGEQPIRIRCQIEQPDHVIILDPTLIPVVEVTAGLRAAGWILINSDKEPPFFDRFLKGGWQVATVDASSIACRHDLGTRTNPIVNTAILGAFSASTGLVRLESVLEAIADRAPGRREKNQDAAQDAAAEVLSQSFQGVSHEP